MIHAGDPLSAERLLGPVDEVAPSLLGLLLVGRDVVTRIVEVEAYDEHDPASHSHRGPTPGNETMFGPAGRLYVFLNYGVHHCGNVVVGPAGHGVAVLLRALEVVEGGEVAVRRRGGRGAHSSLELAGGPGRTGQVLDLSRADDGLDLLAADGELRLLDDHHTVGAVGVGPRVGVRQAPDRPRRWWIEGHPAVSRYQRHPRADAP